MHAQTTQDQQLQSGCNHYWSGLVLVFLPVVQLDFKSLVLGYVYTSVVHSDNISPS